MIYGGRRDPAELIAGTAFGGLAGPIDFGPGVNGLVRGTVGGGLFNAAQGKFEDLLDYLLSLHASTTMASTNK